jgi:hypothetical protein
MSKHDARDESVAAGVSRREFIKRTAAGAGAVAAQIPLAGCGGGGGGGGGGTSGSAPPPAGPTSIPSALPSKNAWKFGIMGDTQWVDADDGKNPNTCAADIINQVNRQFINGGVKFVVHVGDLADNGNSGGVYNVPTVGGGSYPMANGQIGEDTRALFGQVLYNAGIGLFPLRGNHDAAQATAREFVSIYPQTQAGGTHNASPTNVLTVNNPDAAGQPSPGKTGSGFSVGTNFTSPTANLKGLTYAFDFNNARFILLDQFVPLDGNDPDGAPFNVNTTMAKQQSWIDATLAGKPAGGHAFVFAHKGLCLQQHVDTLFGADPSAANSPGMDAFITSLQNNGVRLFFCGHDHMYDRSLVATSDGSMAKVTQIISSCNSNKFYTPRSPSVDALVSGGKRQTVINQELLTIGYYIVTVDDDNVTVEFFSAAAGSTPDGKPPMAGTEYQMAATPVLAFTRREAFGYGLKGQQFIVGQGKSFTAVQDTSPGGTVARILAGANSNAATDPSGRPFSMGVNTAWMAANRTASDILMLTGMAPTLGSPQTEAFVLSLTFDRTKTTDAQIQGGSVALATPDAAGNWANAVNSNSGGAKSFVLGPWKSSYDLGTHGVDTTNNTVWAVINTNGYFAAVAGV